MALKGRAKSVEHRRKLAEANIGKRHSIKTRAKMSAAHKGRPKSAAHRAAISAGRMGIVLSEETRRRISVAKKGMTGHPMSDETKIKLRLARLGWHPDQAARAKMRAAKLGKPGPWTGKKRGPMPPEWRHRIALGNKGNPPAFPNRRFYYAGIPFRSSYESRVAESFDRLGISWQYESHRFDLSVTQTYCPDFWLPDLGMFWEVKGWYGPKSRMVVELFRQRYPSVPLVVATLPVILQLEHAASSRKVA